MRRLESDDNQAFSILNAVRPLMVGFFASVIAISVAGCDSGTEVKLVDIPPDKVPPKRTNPVPPPKEHGPRYGVSPNLGAAK